MQDAFGYQQNGNSLSGHAMSSRLQDKHSYTRKNILKQIIFMGVVFCSFVVVASFLVVLLQLLQVICHCCHKKPEGTLYIRKLDENLIQTLSSTCLCQVLL